MDIKTHKSSNGSWKSSSELPYNAHTTQINNEYFD